MSWHLLEQVPGSCGKAKGDEDECSCQDISVSLSPRFSVFLRPSVQSPSRTPPTCHAALSSPRYSPWITSPFFLDYLTTSLLVLISSRQPNGPLPRVWLVPGASQRDKICVTGTVALLTPSSLINQLILRPSYLFKNRRDYHWICLFLFFQNFHDSLFLATWRFGDS